MRNPEAIMPAIKLEIVEDDLETDKINLNQTSI